MSCDDDDYDLDAPIRDSETWPTHCYSCGVYLMGGATEHKPECEFQRIIAEAFGTNYERLKGR